MGRDDRDCGSCKCYICGNPHCLRSLCHKDNPLENCQQKEDCGKYIYDSAKQLEAIMPAEIRERTF